MNVVQIQQLINNGEGIRIKFISLHDELTNSVFETVVSFLNTIGGYLILGVKDNKEIIGVDEELSGSIKAKFANLVNNKEKINPPMPLMLQEIYVDYKLLLYAYIPESSEVHKLNNQFIYERTDEGDRNITENSYAVKRLYNRKSSYKTEDIILSHLTLDDFNMDTVNKARKLSEIKSQSNNWKNLSNEEILKQKYFYKIDKVSGKYGFNLASLLLFGKKESISGDLPWYKVDVLKRIRDLTRYDDRFICEENLIESYDELLKYIESNIEKPFFLNKDGITYNAVGVIVREIVSNILIHREFMDQTTARILIYSDKIVSENANSPKLFTKVDLNNNEPFSKNPIIARVFRMIGYADEVGSGFEKIKNICDEFFSTTPIIEDKDIFKIVISFKNDSIVKIEDNSKKEKILTFIKENGKINNEQCRSMLQIEKTQASNLLNELLSLSQIYRHGKGKATYYNFEKNEF